MFDKFVYIPCTAKARIRKKNTLINYKKKKGIRKCGLGPFLKKDISALERVQRKAARFCSQNYSRYASVTDMIKHL